MCLGLGFRVSGDSMSIEDRGGLGGNDSLVVEAGWPVWWARRCGSAAGGAGLDIQRVAADGRGEKLGIISGGGGGGQRWSPESWAMAGDGGVKVNELV